MNKIEKGTPLYNTFENSLFKFMIVIDLSFMIVIDCWIILYSVLIPKYLNKRRKENLYEKKKELTLGTSEVSF